MNGRAGTCRSVSRPPPRVAEVTCARCITRTGIESTKHARSRGHAAHSRASFPTRIARVGRWVRSRGRVKVRRYLVDRPASKPDSAVRKPITPRGPRRRHVGQGMADVDEDVDRRRRRWTATQTQTHRRPRGARRRFATQARRSTCKVDVQGQRRGRRPTSPSRSTLGVDDQGNVEGRRGQRRWTTKRRLDRPASLDRRLSPDP